MTVGPLASFDITGRVAFITGGAGMLGVRHAEIIAAAGGLPVLVDISEDTESVAAALGHRLSAEVLSIRADITRKQAVVDALDATLSHHGRVDILINNAANNPKVETDSAPAWSRFENLSLEQWTDDLDVILTGSFLCSQVVGSHLAASDGGVILNIASDLAVISPDQRLYRQPGLSEDEQPVKPVTYSVGKTGLLGLTRYLATYWADKGVRVNAISPGGVWANQPDLFVDELVKRIPMGRMAREDEYQGLVLFLCSEASSYITGQNIVIDGGRSVW